MPIVEYRVRPVVRYIVTRYHQGDGPGKNGVVETKGEFDNFDTAYSVGYALCKHEHNAAGTPPGDTNFIYPEHVAPTVPGEASTDGSR